MAISKKAGAKKAGAVSKPPPSKSVGGASKGGVARADWREGFKKPQAGVSDMTLLSKVTNEAINENLQKRFQNAEIYTYIGNVLISVNPFRDLGIYTDKILQTYRGKNRLEMTPHVFAIAEGAYYNMNAYKENQCVIISGESGAGKTEAAKRIMQYIAAVSGGSNSGIQDVKDMVLATNPLLESFGCAKTLRNNNSSRHGKYLEIMFNAHGEPIGANITNYLLEKNRVVQQIRDERNFHIFYQFTKAASAAHRDNYGIQGPEAYAYTANSQCLDVNGIDDHADYKETISAMNTIGLTADEQDNIFRMIATILWIGNVQYVENQEGNAEISDPGVPDFVAYLLEVDAGNVTKALTQRIVETQRGGRRGSVYEVPLNPTQAAAARDALAKAIYNNMFDWIVERINRSMNPRIESSNVIGVLDIYGFEIFDNNSFEQLCINYVNEKLQQIFIELTLKKEQEEYAYEQIQWTPIKYFNNKIVCDLIEEKRPPGIFSALNDACATAHADPTAADNSFIQRTGMLSSNPHFDSRGTKFLIKHYAGDVMYNVQGMTDKNKDSLLKDILDLVDSSANPYLQKLFPDRPDPNSKKRPPTAGDRIKASANALVENLMRAQPSYIRTIKPNQNKSPTEYDTQAILHQIKYLGLQENIRVRRAGFAYRNTFEKMVERFYLLSPSTSYAGEYTWQGDVRSGCERILIDTGIAREEWQMGVTKAFIKNPETLFALETMRDRYWHNMAMRIQRAYRNYLRYKEECARRIQRMWKNNKEGLQYIQLRDYGHQVLAGRKERRRFSLLGTRRFMGDYLDVGGSNGKGGGSAEGQMLRQASGMGPGESVAFSSRIQVLVSRLGRSSVRSPRFLILTDKAIYILVTQMVNNQVSTTCERRINLGSISAVGLSNLRDDWAVLNVTNAAEADPLFHCYFKTELVTHLLQRTNGAVNVIISNSLEYTKKKDKKAHITFKKDEMVKNDDVYKSSTVSVCTGEPANSVSRPAPKKKAGLVRPITSGKLLRAGGPSNPNNKPKPRAIPRSTPTPAKLPGSGTASAAAPPAAAIATASAGAGAGAGRSAPSLPSPPVAAAPTEPEVLKYKALYAFTTENAGEMALEKDDVVVVTQKDETGSGWWLVKKNGVEGWAPSNYLELIPQAPPTPKAAPAPPVKRAPPAAPAATKSGSSTPNNRPAVAAKPAFGGAVPAIKPKPAAKTAPAGARPHERPAAVQADATAAPVAVMPGLGAPGGFAAVLAKKKAENAAAAAAANGNGASNGAAPPIAAKPPVAPKPAGATNGRAIPPTPPRR
ncbi:probable Myosin I [Melanopsichium pennsylvanicum]|uniref:Myosin I n=2 Tax=Melanopsichium pennsylvanicum TaxID=63383 RepID=A0A077R6Y3_9BASI|nr:myosin I [Melanopsichium pennsylvanicum 4]SNX86354.1 probable Myosin I [Melanopsichium pennsylvanicum]